MPVSLSSNEYSEHNENVGNVSEIEEDQTDNNLIEDNFADSSFIEPTSQQWTSSTSSSSFQKKAPNIRLMTPEQKRRFKVKVLNVMGNILDEPIPATLTGQNPYNSEFDKEYQNTENRIIYSTTPSPLSSSSTSMPISPPMNLVQQSTSLQLNQNNTQNWTYQ
ncbi:hypothetical protein QTP88_027794 [Uroleucon formosanum]